MKLNNLISFRITKTINVSDIDSLNAKLRDFEYVPCHLTQSEKIGWSPVADDKLSVEIDDGVWLRLTKETRNLPAQVVSEAVQDRINKIEETEGRQVKRAEKLAIKDAVVSELLPKAFSKKVDVWGVVSNGFVFVFTSSGSDAELFLAVLRKSLGSLPVVGICAQQLQGRMTEWLAKYPPEGLKLGDSVVLQGDSGVNDDRPSRVKIVNEDLKDDEVQEHLRCGKLPTELGLSTSQFAFKLTDDFKIKSITPSQSLLEAELGDAAKDEYKYLTMRFMAREIYALVNLLLDHVEQD